MQAENRAVDALFTRSANAFEPGSANRQRAVPKEDPK